MSLIRQRLLKAQSRQKSYADGRHRPLEFKVSDHGFLNVKPKRGVIRFGKRGKLSPRFIGVRPGKKLKIFNLARKGKMVIFSEWDRLKPVIFLNLG